MQVFSWFVIGKEVWKTKCLHWCKRWRPWKRYNNCRKLLLSYSDSETGILRLRVFCYCGYDPEEQWVRQPIPLHSKFWTTLKLFPSVLSSVLQTLPRKRSMTCWYWMVVFQLCNVMYYVIQITGWTVLDLSYSCCAPPKFCRREVQKEEVSWATRVAFQIC